MCTHAVSISCFMLKTIIIGTRSGFTLDIQIWTELSLVTLTGSQARWSHRSQVWRPEPWLWQGRGRPRSRSWLCSVSARLRLRQLNKSVCRPQTPADHYTTSAVSKLNQLNKHIKCCEKTNVQSASLTKYFMWYFVCLIGRLSHCIIWIVYCTWKETIRNLYGLLGTA